MTESIDRDPLTKRARALRKSGKSWRQIADALGINVSAVRYRVCPKRRQYLRSSARQWRADHPEECREVNKRAVQRFGERHPERYRDIRRGAGRRYASRQRNRISDAMWTAIAERAGR